MKITPSGIAGMALVGPDCDEFEAALAPLLGGAPRELLAPALPFSVIVVNDSGRAVSLLGVRFDMTGPRGKPYSVIHYADTLRNPAKSDFLPGTARFVCAEPSFTALVLRGDDTWDRCERNNLDNLRRMLSFRAALDSVAWDDGRFEGPDSCGAFERLGRQREVEAEFRAQVVGADPSEAESLLNGAVDDPANRTRRALAMKLLEGLQMGGREEMLSRAQGHRLKIAVWRPGTRTGSSA
jgi:hypothetical protein